MINIKENIRILARERGYNLTELEEAAGLGNGVIGKWDRSYPRVDKLLAVANTLDVTLNDILGIKKEPADRGPLQDYVDILMSLPEEKRALLMDLAKSISQGS